MSHFLLLRLTSVTQIQKAHFQKHRTYQNKTQGDERLNIISQTQLFKKEKKILICSASNCGA